MAKVWIPDTVEQVDGFIRGARIKRAELKAFGVTNSALKQIDDYIDRLLDARSLLMELTKAGS